MTNKQTLLDKINSELKTEKNPVAISALKFMREKAMKKKSSPAIVNMFDTIRNKRTPEQQEAMVKELEAADKLAREAELAKFGPSYARVLPEKIDLDIIAERIGAQKYSEAHALTEKMDRINFGDKDAEAASETPTETPVETPEPVHLSTEADFSQPWQTRMHEAAEKAGLDTTNFVKAPEVTSQEKPVQYDGEDKQEVGIKDFVSSVYIPYPEKKKDASHLLEEGASVYRGRNATYGDSYKKQGEVMKILFPNGLTLNSAKDFNRITILTTIISKLLRYSNDFNKPHDDSVLDNMVYNAMLLEIDRGE